MARTIRKSGVKEVPLSEVKDDLSRYLREAETQEIVITRHGKPAGVLIGFNAEEDGSKTTRDFSVASSRPARACTQCVGIRLEHLATEQLRRPASPGGSRDSRALTTTRSLET